MVDLSKLSKKYSYERGTFIAISGKLSGQATEQKKVIGELLEIGCEYDEIPQALIALGEACAKNTKGGNKAEREAEHAEIIEELLRETDFASEFKAVSIRGEILTYLFTGNTATLIQSGFPKTQEWVNILLTYKNEAILNLKKRLAAYLNPKAPYRVSPEEVAGLIAVNLDFSLRQDLKVAMNSGIKPISLSTTDDLSHYKLPYSPVESPKLNPTMEEFLSRVSDHEYLCAIFWIMFNGRKAPYVVYLYGNGGEGKSAFLNAISNQIRSVAAFQDANHFSYFQMYGAAMILLAENTDCFLLQKAAVKAVTGNSKVPCEPKNGKTFTANLSGILVADSNKMLKIKGEDNEQRRLRLFKVKKATTTKLVDAETYTEMLEKDFNEFINYCRVCYEKVGSEHGWLVPTSPTQERDFKTLTDRQFIHTSEQVLSKVLKDANIEYGSKESSIPASLFWSTFFRLSEAKDKYLADNLKDYLYLHKNVVEVGDVFYGLRKKEHEGTYFEQPIDG